MARFAALIREPALLIDFFESVVVLFVALGLFSLHGDQQEYLIAAFIALLAFVKGFLTHPFPVTVVPDLGRALLVVFASFGVVHLSADQITIAVTVLGTLMTLVQRSQISPRYDSIARPGGAGAGPVTSEAGSVGLLFVLGVVVLVLGLLTIFWWGSLIVGIILVLLGLALMAAPTYSNRGGTYR